MGTGPVGRREELREASQGPVRPVPGPESATELGSKADHDRRWSDTGDIEALLRHDRDRIVAEGDPSLPGIEGAVGKRLTARRM